MTLLQSYKPLFGGITFFYFMTHQEEYHISPSLFKRGIFRHRRMRLWRKGEFEGVLD